METVKHVCTNCEKEFEREAGREYGVNAGKNTRRFCSKDCTKKYWNRINSAKRFRPILPRPCENCGVQFTPEFVRTKRFCSKKCADHVRNSGYNAHRRPESFTCPGCGQVFKPRPGQGWTETRKKFCSYQCRNRSTAKQWSINHPGWRKEQYKRRRDATRFGGNWIKAMERDQFTCQICRTQEKERLIVHHLDGEGNKRSRNHSLENLQVLCKTCHGKVHHELNVQRRDGKLFVKIGDKYMEVIE